MGLRQQAKKRTAFPEPLLVALGFRSSRVKSGGRVATKALVTSADMALGKLKLGL